MIDRDQGNYALDIQFVNNHLSPLCLWCLVAISNCGNEDDGVEKGTWRQKRLKDKIEEIIESKNNMLYRLEDALVIKDSYTDILAFHY